MNDGILSLLGICRRSGKLVIGADPSADSVKKNKARLVIFADDFSQNSKKHVLQTANEHSVPALTLNRTKDEVSAAVGRLCGVMAVEDRGFAEKLKALIEDEQGGEIYDKI